MKKLLFSIILCTLCSCGEGNNSVTDQNTDAELRVFQERDSIEQNTEQFIRDYIATLNMADWKTDIVKYLQPDSDAFLEQHTAFRKSLPNYKSTIKHVSVDGKQAIVWLNCTANYESTYTFEDTFIDEVIQNIEAKGQPLSWDETWYFDVVDGRFGDEWDFLKDNYAILEGLEANRPAVK